MIFKESTNNKRELASVVFYPLTCFLKSFLLFRKTVFCNFPKEFHIFIFPTKDFFFPFSILIVKLHYSYFAHNLILRISIIGCLSSSDFLFVVPVWVRKVHPPRHLHTLLDNAHFLVLIQKVLFLKKLFLKKFSTIEARALDFSEGESAFTLCPAWHRANDRPAAGTT